MRPRSLIAILPWAFAVVVLVGFAPHEAAAQEDGPTQTVFPDSPLIPDVDGNGSPDLGAGDKFRLLFLTSTMTDAATSGPDFYNTFVQTAANSSSTNISAFSGQFRALVSSATNSTARVNTFTTNFTIPVEPGFPIYWLNGAQVADDYLDFYDGSWDSRVARNEDGAVSLNPTRVWTGATAEGYGAEVGAMTPAYMAQRLGTSNPRVGRLNVADREIDGQVTRPQAEQYPLYAVSPLMSIVAPPDTRISALELSGHPPISPAFSPAITEYRVSVPNDTTSIRLTPTLANAATATINAPTTRAITSGVASDPILLNLGVTQIRIVVTATASTTVTTGATFTTAYDVYVTRLGAPPSPPGASSLLSSSPLAPPGVRFGEPFRLLFVDAISSAVNGNYSHYNGRVAGAAATGHADIRVFSSQFRALISTAAVDARDNTATRPDASGETPIYWLGGDKVADDYADFYDGDWASRAARDSNGNLRAIAGLTILTGSLESGVGQPGTRIGDRGNGQRIGRLDAGAGNEIDSGTVISNDFFPLYGLSPVLMLVAPGPSPPTVRAPIPDQSAAVRVPFEYIIPADTFDDLNGDELTYSVPGLPGWLSFDAATRRLSGTAPSFVFNAATGNVVAPTPFTIIVTASDGHSDSADASDTFTLNLNAGVPLAPTNVRVITGDRSIQVSWDSSANGGGYPVRRYEATISFPNPGPHPPVSLTRQCAKRTFEPDFNTCNFNTSNTVTNGVRYFDLKVTAAAGPATFNEPFTATTSLGSDFVVVPTGNLDRDAFVTTWRTTAANETITVPTNAALTYSYTVNWGDATAATDHTGNATHTYAAAGDYIVSITGAFPQIYFNNGGDRTKIRSIRQWGPQVWQSMANSFTGCTNLIIEGGAGLPDVSAAASLRSMFQNTGAFNSPIGHWEVGTVTDMAHMFQNASAFNQDVSAWDVGAVTDMGRMFNGASAFNQPIGGWDVGEVTDMTAMFNAASAFNQDVSAWDVSNVTTAAEMLNGVTLSTANYDALLNGWSDVTGGETALRQNVPFHAGNSRYCAATARAHLSAANRWMITDGGRDANCPPDADAFVTTWRTTTANESITIPVNIDDFTYDYTVDWGDGLADLNQTGNAMHTYAEAGTYTVSITGAFPHIFIRDHADAGKLLTIEQWGTQVWGSMWNSFVSCANLTIAPTAGRPDLSAVTNMRRMFVGATSLNSPIGDWDVSNVTNLSAMFANARSFNQDLSAWDVSNVTNMNEMFTGAIAFDQNLGDWDVGMVREMINLLNHVTLSNEHYDLLLAGWSRIDDGESELRKNVIFNAGDSRYCNQPARDALDFSPNDWSITDGGAAASGCSLMHTAGERVANQTYTVGGPVTLVLPRVTGGTKPLTYSLTPLPPGLTLRAATADTATLLIGAPSEAMPNTLIRYTVAAADSESLEFSFSIRIAALELGAAVIPDQAYTVGAPAPTLNLMAATGGVGALYYTLTPAPPPGLIFNRVARTLSGTPTTPTVAGVMTFTVTDANLAARSQTFHLAVAAQPTISPVADQAYTVTQSVAVTLPKAAGGAAPLTYALTRTDGGSPLLPPMLTFGALERTITGVPNGAFGGVGMRYTITDANGIAATADFTLRVADAPSFSVTIPAQMYIAGIAIPPLTLPDAGGGVGLLTYTLTPTASIPDGLTFDATARSFEGMPTTPTAAVTLTYTVTDANGVATSQDVMVTVNAALTIADVEVGEGDGMATVTVRLEHEVTGGFRVDVTTTNDTATADADYIAVIGHTLTFDGDAGEPQTFNVTIVDDALLEVSETVTLWLDNLEGNSIPVDTSNTATLTITDDDSVFTVNSVDYYADEAVSLPITEAAVNTHFYMVIEFSADVQHVNTVDDINLPISEIVMGQPGIFVQGRQFIPSLTAPLLDKIPIRADNTAFPNPGSACRPRFAGDTSEYLCQIFLAPGAFGLGALRLVVEAGRTSDIAGNTLAEDYVDLDGGIEVVDTQDRPIVNAITHYSDAGRTTTISGTVEDGSIYSVIEFTGLIIASPVIFYQIGTAPDAVRVQFGRHTPGDTPENGTCALIDGDYTMAVANQSFLCRYNTRTGDTGTYKVIVGTDTTDTAGETLAGGDYTDDAGVMLGVTTGTATLSIADVEVDEGAGTATVSVTVDDAVMSGFSVDAMTADDDGTATDGEDYTAVSDQILSFAGTFAGETLSFTVPILDDALYEGGASGDVKETVVVSLVNPQNADNVDSSNTATIRITDNEYQVALTMEDFSVNESAGMATVSVSLDTAVPDAFSVVASTEDGTGIGIATADEDYTAVSGQILSFAGTFAGEIQTFSVTIPPGDTTPEFPETLTVSLSNLDVPTDTATRVGTLRPVSATITIMDDDINTRGVNLNLLFPVTVDGKTYFYLDQNGNGVADTGDGVTHNALDNSLNGSGDTEATQDGVHNGQDDERAVIVGDTVLILPTLAELTRLRSSQSDTAPANWQNPPSEGEYWTANPVSMSIIRFVAYRFFDGMTDNADRSTRNFVAFQVRTLPTFSAGIATPQTYTIGQTVALTLPEAGGGVGTLSYTLTRDDGSPVLPAGLSFNPAERTISGRPSEPFGGTAGASLRYTATDATGAARDILFVLQVATAPALVAIADQTYTATTVVNLTLPVSTGGTTPLTYTLTPSASIPAGLTFDAAEGTLKGMPTTATAGTLTYAVTDALGVVASQTFMVTVNAMLSIANVSVDEGIDAATVTVSLDIAVTDGFSVDISTMDDTAIADEDYTAVIRQRLFFTGNAGETHTVSIAITNDEAAEGTETLTLLLTDLDGTTAPVVIGNPAMVTITDDDTAVLTLVSTASLEPPSGLTFHIIATATLLHAVPGGFTVVLATADGTATAGDDYTAISPTLTFDGDAGESQDVRIPVLPDGVPERDETVMLSFRDLDGTQADVDIRATATGTISLSDGGIVGFGDAVIADQVYVANTIIAPLLLPEPIAAEIGRDNFLEYTLTPSAIPAGLSFDAATHTLRGMPTALTATPAILTYTARNFFLSSSTRVFSAATFESTSASLTFSVTVVETGVASVSHYSDDTTATPITDLVSSGEIYSVVVFGANVSNAAIAYTLGANVVQFDIVADDAMLESGDCQAASATDTTRYTCRYSVTDSVAATDPGAYTVSVSAATDVTSGMALDAYGADTGVTIGVRPTVESVTYYSDIAAANAATSPIPSAVSGRVIYARIDFSEKVQHIAAPTGQPAIVVTAFEGFLGIVIENRYAILAHGAELRDNACRATLAADALAADTSAYLCQINLDRIAEYLRVQVLQETHDLAGHTLAMAFQTADFTVNDAPAPVVSSIMHYADAAGTMPIRDGDVVSGGEIYSLIQFTSVTLRRTALAFSHKLGSADSVAFNIDFLTKPPLDGHCDRFARDSNGLNPQIRCHYSVGAADDGLYQVIVGTGTQDFLGQALNTDDSVVDSGVTISALRFATGAGIADQHYAVGQTVALTLPQATGGVGTLTYTLTSTSALPDGLTFDAATGSIKGEPRAESAAIALTYTVTDSAAMPTSLSLTFSLAVSNTRVLSIADVVVGEGDGMATVTVTLDAAVTGGFMVDALLLDVTATAGADYIADVSRTLTFAGTAGDTQTFSVTIADDAFDEGDSETVTLSLDNLQGTGVPVDISDTATLTITDDDSGLTVESVGYFADEAATIPITQVAIGSSIYIVVQFSENVQQVNTVFSEGVIGRPTIRVRSYQLSFSSGIRDERIPILADNTAFPNEDHACRTQVAGVTSAYLCQFFLPPLGIGPDAPLQVVLTADAANTIGGNALAVEYVHDGIDVVVTPAAPTVMSITHYSDADIETAPVITPTDTVTGGTIYSVIQFTGLPIASPQISYQIGTASDAVQVPFGSHTTGGTPENETCALLDGGDGTAAANQSFLCRYNTRTGTTGTTYQVIVGTGTTDTAGQPLAAPFTSSVTLDVMTGTATLSIADVEVDEGAGTVTVSVMVDDAVMSGFSVDAMTADDAGTATDGLDYTAVSGQILSFAGTFAGETLSFTVPIIDDALYEGGALGVAETVVVSLVNLQNATNVDHSVTATISITDNEYQVALTMEDVSVSENAGTATVSVSLDTAVPGAFSVVASTADDTATAVEDYTAVSGQTLSFAGTFAGETLSFTVTITDDSIQELTETLMLSLSNLQVPTDTATTMGTLRPVSATITIMDDDINTSGVNLHLIFPVTVDGKTYRYLDNNGNSRIDSGDRVTHIVLNTLLNGDGNSSTAATQDGVHNGQDDARSVIVGDTVLILPTVNELMALRSSPSNAVPARWQTLPDNENYWTANPGMRANLNGPIDFFQYDFFDGMATEVDRIFGNYVAFQVRTLPTFSLGIADQTYTVGQTVALMLPEAGGGVGTLSYTLTRDDDSPVLPAGLSFDPMARTISGRPSESFGDTAGARMRYTATDTTGAVRDILFVLRVAAAPALVAIDDQNYTANTAVNLTLPAATGGIAPLTYTLTPSASLPTDLVFDAAELTLKGIPPATATAAVTLTYTVTDANGFTAEQTFALEVFSAPAIAANAVSDQIYTVNQPVALALPEADAGARPLTYTLTRIDGGTPVLPDGLTFDPVARTISDAPKATFGAGAGVSLRYTVTDTNGAVASTDFTLLVNAAVTFNTSAIPAPDSAYTYPLNTAITTLTLPPAIGGTGVLTYTLTPTASIPEGLTFDATALTLADVPTMVTAAVTLTYAATDANDVAATLTFTVAVVDRPAVTITDSIATDTANIVDGDVIFTFTFSEDVSGFDVSGISLTGGTASGPLNGTAPGATYTLAVTPTPDTNAGIISVTVMENAAIGETTNTGNIATTTPATQNYDTLAPDAPAFQNVGVPAGYIDAVDEANGLLIAGINQADTRVILCLAGGSGDECGGTGSGRTTRTTNALPGTSTIRNWSYMLTTADISAMDEGDETLTATAIDTNGNPSEETAVRITVDTIAPDPPTFNLPAAGDIINIAERDAGVTIGGDVENGASVSVCLGAASLTDEPCTGGTTITTPDGVTVTDTTWRYTLSVAEVDAMGQGDEFLLATTIDPAGNRSMLGSTTINVDTTVPAFTSGLTGAVAVGVTSATVTAYDATARDNNGGDDAGITYTLGGPNAGLFSIVADTGIVTYNDDQNVEDMHTIVITATDTAGNTAERTVTISALNAPAVDITSSTPIMDYANGVITFTISFSEAVTGFEPTGDVSVAGGTGGAITPTPVAAITYTLTDTFTLAVTPNTNNDGDLTVTVRANAVMGAVTLTGNPETVVTLEYDTVAPIITDGATATAMFIVNDPVATEVYNADATDGGGMADDGITYSLSGINAGLFTINPATGSVTYQTSPTDAAAHTIVITATDKGGNTDTITVTVTAVLSDNAALSALTIVTSGGAAVPLSPAFATATSVYTANIRQEVTSVTITLPTAHAGAGADITGIAADGTALTVTDSTITGSTATRATISGLTEGISPNTITITVTAADRATMTVYTITLIRAPLLTFGTAADGTAITIADQTYDIGEAIPTLTLPEATGGLGTLSYTLTPTADIPAGLTFAPATRSLSGTPTATETRTLTYTVTDAANPPVTTELTFNVLTRAPLLTFGTAADGTAITIADQTYDIGETIPALTLPEATGGLGTRNYTLTPTDDIPAGLTFAPATRSLSGTPTATETRTLTYTVTDAATPPVTTELTFSVNIVRRTMVKASDTTIALDLDEDGDKTTTDPGNAILTLPSGHSVTEATLNTPPETATNNPPAGVAFSLTTDITLDATLAAAATVCLPTTGVPAGREPVLYHYFTRAGQGAATWNEISRDTATREGYVCGETLTFSPFAVGYMTGVMGVARLNEQILPRASLVMSASMLAAVAARVEAAADSTGGGGIGAGIGSIDGTGGTGGIGDIGGTDGNSIGTTPTLAYQFGGRSSLHGLFESHGKAMLEGQMEYEQLLDGASFVVPLSTTGDASADNAGDADRRAGAIVFWGNSDYHSLSNNQNGLDWGGPVLSAHLGMDGRINQHLLTGVALSWNRARFDYHDEADGADTTGEYQYRNVSFNPYFGWLPVEGFKLWGTFGYGRGEIQIDEDGSDEYSSDTTQSSLAGGFSHRLFAVTGHPGIGLLSGGVITLKVKGDATLARVGVESSEEDIAAQDVDSQRLRLLLAGEVQYGLANGGALRPSLEIGMRYDGGDGETGSGLEVGSGLRYTNPIETLAVAGNVRTSLAQGYAEWGGGFTVQLSPRAGRGLSLSLHPVWGRTQSMAERLWRDGVDGVGNATGDTALQRSVDTEIGYGVGASALGKAGVLTPYTGINVTEGTRRLRMGGRFAGDDGLRLSLEGARENTVDGVSHTVLLRGGVEF